MPKVNLDIRIGAKELLAIACAIPIVYERVRKVKLKYDLKEQSKGVKGTPVMFDDIIIDAQGRTWRRED